jgi:hypothetical protein
MLALLSVAELLGMALWFTGSAVGPQLREAWSLSASQVAWLTTAVQLGFVVGTAMSAVLNLADVVPARRLFAIAAVCGAVANLPLAFTSSLSVALVSRFLAGCFLAGVYPPAMKMAATWFRARRGLAVGTIVTDDPPPELFVNDAAVAEGASGTTNLLNFTIRLAPAIRPTSHVQARSPSIARRPSSISTASLAGG